MIRRQPEKGAEREVETEAPPVKLMVVEDDLSVAAVLKARLQIFGYQVCQVVHTGPSAVQSALEHRPDLVLMDILLQGGINGLEAAELIHNQIDVPIVFITCLSDRHMLEPALKNHAYGYILKPYTEAELKYTIQIALIKYQALKDREKLIVRLKQALLKRKQAEEALRASNDTLEQRIIERTRMEKARSKQIQLLTAELIEAEERERLRLSELLHDDLQPSLAAARLHLELACRDMPPAPLLQKVVRMIADCVKKARNLSHQLSPAVFYRLDLIAALNWLSRQMEEQFGLKVHVKVEAAKILITRPLQVFIIRAVQEFLFNIVKHAGVMRARVVLSNSEKEVTVAVSDKGRGFNPAILDKLSEKAGLGLFSLQERAGYFGGSLDISSTPMQGSCFTLKLPLARPGPGALQGPRNPSNPP